MYMMLAITVTNAVAIRNRYGNYVEPGLYIACDADVPEQYKGIGIRIEDNLLMTEYGNKNLTSGCPKEIADIEEIMAVA